MKGNSPILDINEINKKYTAEVSNYINNGYIIIDTLNGRTVLRNLDTGEGVCVNKATLKDVIVLAIHPVVFNWYNCDNTVIRSDMLDKTIYYKMGKGLYTTDADYWQKCEDVRTKRNAQNRDDFFTDYIKHELGYKNCEIITYPHTKQFIKFILPMINRKCGFKSIRANHIRSIVKVTDKDFISYIATFTAKAPTKMPCLAFKKYYQMDINELIF